MMQLMVDCCICCDSMLQRSYIQSYKLVSYSEFTG